LLAWIEKNDDNVKGRCVHNQESDRQEMQENVMSRDGMFMVDEEIPFDRSPGRQDNAQNEQCVVDQYPKRTEKSIHDITMMQKQECEWKFGHHEQEIDDEEQTKHLVDHLMPFEEAETSEHERGHDWYRHVHDREM
jgi:hypothetical protein